jgi:hypothetical protein
MVRSSDEVVTWLRGNPSLDELAAAYPDEWDAVKHDIDRVVARNDPAALKDYVTAVARPVTPSAGRRPPRRALLAAEIRRQMTIQALKQAALAASTGITEGPIRFGFFSGTLLQKLLFRRDLERKPVSRTAFRLVWPLLRQRRRLMPLVTQKGIYCFYSRALIARLAAHIGERSCLEIAAGDGTLSRFLVDAGVHIVATDDHSWDDSVLYPESVLQQDARTALRTYQPSVVVCSWPPAGNPFEQHVFTAPSVDEYILITPRHEASAGNWAAYREQTAFTFAEEPALSRLVLPPELDPAVYLFRRV